MAPESIVALSASTHGPLSPSLSEAVERYGGEVTRTDADGLAARFHSPVDAVSCALSFRSRDPAPRPCFGLHADTDPERARVVATAIAAAARAGGVWISQAVYPSIRSHNHIWGTSLGSHTLAGETTELYEVAGFPSAPVDSAAQRYLRKGS